MPTYIRKDIYIYTQVLLQFKLFKADYSVC